MTYEQVEERAQYKAGTVMGQQLEVSDLDRYEAFKELFLGEQYEKWKTTQQPI